jgi:hypothetical protein
MFEGYKRKKLERRRTEALSTIRGEQLNVEVMAQRPRRAEDDLDDTFLKNVLGRIGEIEGRAKQATKIDDLDDLIDDAEQQGQLRAYICPLTEIADEGSRMIDLIEEWSVPKTVIAKLRGSLGQKLEKGDTDPEAARSALRALLEEYDSWASYTDDYEETMQRFTRCSLGQLLCCRCSPFSPSIGH